MRKKGRLLGVVLLGSWLLLTQASCHRYQLPNPMGPQQAKGNKGATNTADQSADGRDNSQAQATARPQRNTYDKHGLLKKKKYERRRLKRKVGQRMFLGRALPF